ncbi:MAG: hypothetical protein Q9207_008481 [Kuettlingeria erythrocarpa]
MFAFQGNSAPQTSQAAAPSNSAFQFRMTVENVQKGPQKPFRFFALPRELRDKIYRELLCSGKVHEPVNSWSIARRYRYQVAILRCNRQTNIEATPIFYGENLFIMFELGWVITSLDIKSLVRPSSTLFKEEKYLLAMRNKINVNVCLSESNKFNGDKFIITPWELLATALLLSKPYRLRPLVTRPWERMVPKWTCIVMCNLPHKHRNQLDTITEGILALGGIRNIGIIRQHSINNPPLSLSSLIRSHPYSIDECLVQASVLEARGDRCMMSRDPSQEFLAYKHYDEGHKYFEGVSMLELTGVTPEKNESLRNKRTWLSLACAVYKASRGHMGSREWLKQFSNDLLEGCGPDINAKYLLYKSCLLMQQRLVSVALHFVWRALLVRPDWSVALELLAEIGKRMQLEPALKAEIPAVFQRLFDPTRPSNRPITAEERREIGNLPVTEFRKAPPDTIVVGSLREIWPECLP